MQKSTAHDETSLVNTDKHAPVLIDGTPIKYSGNPAHAAGDSQSISEFWLRNGHFRLLISTGTVTMSNGKICCTDTDVIPFILGMYSEETYDLDSPCPASPERITNLGARHALDNTILDWNDTSNKKITSDQTRNIVTNPEPVLTEDRKMHASLMHVFSDVPDVAAALDVEEPTAAALPSGKPSTWKPAKPLHRTSPWSPTS